MHKMAVIGDASSVVGFVALGVTVLTAKDAGEGSLLLKKAADEGFAVIFVTEGIALGMIDAITSYSKKPLPIVLTIPDNEGHTGAALEKLRRTVEKALGADILFGKEGTGQ
ncbi:MAG TPA: V-type ATP synthase subunit F [Bacillota bacterium]|nr:V-type ATP synthase subunit F [Bacillota bacterium]HOH09665.1 V-type ATP synthase subunit F [Bacillota bacterium]HOS50293.1 V-type ATP synthase subunit F [Bacillota bacterium]HOY89000.1 V-type ATP synthase subunit F [Bacillota bacterium]HPI00552.1 V-type ATP synthase subunit F [Bacillota bacterium]